MLRSPPGWLRRPRLPPEVGVTAGGPLLRNSRLRGSAEPRFELTSLDLNDSLELHVLKISAVAGGVDGRVRDLQHR